MKILFSRLCGGRYHEGDWTDFLHNKLLHLHVLNLLLSSRTNEAWFPQDLCSVFPEPICGCGYVLIKHLAAACLTVEGIELQLCFHWHSIGLDFPSYQAMNFHTVKMCLVSLRLLHIYNFCWNWLVAGRLLRAPFFHGPCPSDFWFRWFWRNLLSYCHCESCGF